MTTRDRPLLSRVVPSYIVDDTQRVAWAVTPPRTLYIRYYITSAMDVYHQNPLLLTHVCACGANEQRGACQWPIPVVMECLCCLGMMVPVIVGLAHGAVTKHIVRQATPRFRHRNIGPASFGTAARSLLFTFTHRSPSQGPPGPAQMMLLHGQQGAVVPDGMQLEKEDPPFSELGRRTSTGRRSSRSLAQCDAAARRRGCMGERKGPPLPMDGSSGGGRHSALATPLPALPAEPTF